VVDRPVDALLVTFDQFVKGSGIVGAGALDERRVIAECGNGLRGKIHSCFR